MNIVIKYHYQYHRHHRHDQSKLFRVIMTNIKNEIRRRLSLGNVKDFQHIPGPKSLPIIGTLHQYLPFFGRYKFDALHKNGLEKYKRYGPIVREEIVKGVNIVWLFKPEDIEQLFRTEGKYPERRSHLALEKYRLDRPLVYKSGGLLPSNGETWHQMRTAFQKGLSSPAAVAGFIPDSDEIIREFTQILGAGSKKDLIEHDCLPMLSRLFLELTCQSLLDTRLDSFSADEMRPTSDSSRLIKAAFDTNGSILKTDNGMQLWRFFPTPLFRKLERAQRVMEEFAVDKLQLKVTLFDDTAHQKTLLESYLSSKDLDFRDIIGIMCDFLLAGIDTSTYTTSFVLYHLAKNPRVQDDLFEEACRLLPSRHSPMTKSILSEAKFAKAVLKESLRLRPISVGVGRILTDDQVFSGYRVPKKTIIVTQNQISCRLEEYFARPDEFLPERWLKDNCLYKKVHPYLVLPFGHGSRSCIARRLAEQNMLILMLRIAREFKLEWRGEELDTKSLLINTPDGPIALEFLKR